MLNAQIINALEQVEKHLMPQFTQESGSTNPYRYKNLNQFRDAINKIEGLGLFSNITHKLKNTKIFTASYLTDFENLESSEHSTVYANAYALYNRVLGLVETYNALNPDDASTSIILKYKQINDFPELERFSRDLNHAIQIPIKTFLPEEERLNILSIESGSIVLTVSLGTGLLFITKVLDLAFKYKMKWEEAKRVEEYNKSLALDNSLKETVVNAINQQVKLFLQTETEVLAKETLGKEDNEKVEVLKNSICTFHSLLNKGLLIEPSNTVNSEIKSQFEEFKKLNSSEQKLIEMDHSIEQ